MFLYNYTGQYNNCVTGAYTAGYLSDPDDIPGLAHLCEHMLFLGTEKVNYYSY